MTDDVTRMGCVPAGTRKKTDKQSPVSLAVLFLDLKDFLATNVSQLRDL